MLNLRAAQADLLVDLSRLDELKAMSETPGNLQIGALTTHAAIEDGKIPDRFGGLMRRVAGTISYRAFLQGRKLPAVSAGINGNQHGSIREDTSYRQYSSRTD